MSFIEKHLFNCYIFCLCNLCVIRKFLIFILERSLKYLKGNYYLFCYILIDFLKTKMILNIDISRRAKIIILYFYIDIVYHFSFILSIDYSAIVFILAFVRQLLINQQNFHVLEKVLTFEAIIYIIIFKDSIRILDRFLCDRSRSSSARLSRWINLAGTFVDRISATVPYGVRT